MWTLHCGVPLGSILVFSSDRKQKKFPIEMVRVQKRPAWSLIFTGCIRFKTGGCRRKTEVCWTSGEVCILFARVWFALGFSPQHLLQSCSSHSMQLRQRPLHLAVSFGSVRIKVWLWVKRVMTQKEATLKSTGLITVYKSCRIMNHAQMFFGFSNHFILSRILGLS